MSRIHIGWISCTLMFMGFTINAFGQASTRRAVPDNPVRGFFMGASGGMNTAGVSTWLPLTSVDMVEAQALFDGSGQAAVSGSYLRLFPSGSRGVYTGAGAMTVHRDHVFFEKARSSDSTRGTFALTAPAGAYLLMNDWPIQLGAQVAFVLAIYPKGKGLVVPSMSLRYAL